MLTSLSGIGENVKQSNWGDHENERFPKLEWGGTSFYDAFYRAESYKKAWQIYNQLSITEKAKTSPQEDLN